MNTDDLKSSPKEAADAALELAKQLITLSSGVLALSATFIEKLRPFTTVTLVLLIGSWLALILSVGGALTTISAIVQSRLRPENRWHEGMGRNSATLSKWCFVGGLLAFAIVAFASVLQPSRESAGGPSATINIIKTPDTISNGRGSPAPPR